MIDRVQEGGETTLLSDLFLRVLDARSDLPTASALLSEGLPSSFFSELSVLVGLSQAALGRLLDIKVSTRRRWLKAGNLNPTESDYLFRAAVVLNGALGLFAGDKIAMRNWLESPALALGQKTPAELLSTFVGLNLVDALIWKIEHGVVV